MTLESPLLTIGIPTYNRSHLLKGILTCILKEINTLENKKNVEIVVSDNNSTDDTKEIISLFNSKGLAINYFQNEINIGANNNILKIGNELASGKYCWIIGDDDLIREGSINHVISVIKKTEVDVIYMNQTYEEDSKRVDINLASFDESKLLSKNIEDALLFNAEFIQSHSEFSSLYTSISSLIFKVKVWRDKFIGYQTLNAFDSLNNTFPHSVILSESLICKPVYYIGYPYLAFFVGAQEWLSDWPFLCFIRVLELSDLFQKHGASKSFLKKYRNKVFECSDSTLYDLLFSRKSKFQKYFNFISFFKRYGYYSMYLICIKKAFISRLRYLFKKALNFLGVYRLGLD